jgi:hypothetical protein
MFGKGEAHTRVHTNTTYTVRRSLTVADARNRLDLELQRLGARDVLLSTNVQVRLDGLPRSGQGEPADAGAAVYFTLKGKPRCLACDRWNRVADNIAAIAAHVYAIRAVDRYGVGTLDQAFAGYAQLPPAPGQDGDPWWTVLNVSPNASRDDVEAAYRDLAKKNHPDVGGSAELMARINRARDAATRALLVAS